MEPLAQLCEELEAGQPPGDGTQGRRNRRDRNLGKKYFMFEICSEKAKTKT